MQDFVAFADFLLIIAFKFIACIRDRQHNRQSWKALVAEALCPNAESR